MPKQRPLLRALRIFVATNCLVLLYATNLVSAEAVENRATKSLQIGRELGLDPSCNANSSDWLGGDKFQQPYITGDPGECCRRCEETPDCVAWLFKACCDHCWIKDRIPNEASKCLDNDCISGHIRYANLTRIVRAEVQDKENPRPENKQNITAADCEKSGRLSAVGAAFIGCKAILKNCSKAKKSAKSNGDTDIDDRLDALIEPQGDPKSRLNAKDCRKRSIETCEEQVRNSKNSPVVNSDCIALLENGPESSREGCKSKKDVKELFQEKAIGACNKLE